MIQLDDGSERYLPVARWPAGWSYDDADDVILDAARSPVIRRGDRVSVSGVVVDTNGDPAPCFFLRGIEIETIQPI